MNRIQFVETFIRREDAEHFIEEVRGDDPEMAAHLGAGASRLMHLRDTSRSDATPDRACRLRKHVPSGSHPRLWQGWRSQ